jgi:hypothetical protein
MYQSNFIQLNCKLYKDETPMHMGVRKLKDGHEMFAGRLQNNREDGVV